MKAAPRVLTVAIGGTTVKILVIGGGHAKKLKQAPPGCRLGRNANAFLGGPRMWQPAARSQWSRDGQDTKEKGPRS